MQSFACQRYMTNQTDCMNPFGAKKTTSDLQTVVFCVAVSIRGFRPDRRTVTQNPKTPKPQNPE